MEWRVGGGKQEKMRESKQSERERVKQILFRLLHAAAHGEV